MPFTGSTSTPSQAAALRLSALLLGAGTMHFVAPSFFDSTVPRQLPGQARTYTQVSGVAELAIGAALAVPKTRKLGAGLAAAIVGEDGGKQALARHQPLAGAQQLAAERAS